MSNLFGNNPYGTLGPSPTRAARINPRPRRAKPKPKRAGMSAEQFVNAEVAKMIAAQVASIEEQRRVYLDELDKRSRLEAERGMALANALRGMNFPGRMQSIYGSAASDIAGMAQGFSGQIRDIASADAAQQAHMLSGTGQEAAVRNEGVGMADVNYGAQGFIPGRSMSETGAAFAAQAALEPAFAAQIGLMEAGRVHQEGLEGMSDFTKALIEIRAQKPELVRELMAQRQDMLMDQRKMQLDERDAQRDWYLKLAALEMSRGNNERANQYLQLAQQREGRMSQADRRRAMKDKGLDANGNLLPGYEMRGGRIVKVPTTKPKGPSTSSSVPGTAAYNAKAIQNIGKAQKNIETDIQGMLKPTISGGELTTTKPKYQSAYSRLWNKYKYLATTRAAKAALKDAINRALAAAGIQPLRGAPVGSSPGHL